MRLSILVLLFTTLITNHVVADVWSNNNIPPKLSKSLKGVGLNSAGDWGSCRYGANTDADISKVLSHGWQHIVYVICIDDVLEINNKFHYNSDRLKARIKTVSVQIQAMAKRFPDAGFVISLKSREQIGGWNAKGLRTSLIYAAYEKSKKVRADYRKMWQDVALATKSISPNRLAFNLMNEPEYHNRGSRALREWYSAQLKLVDAIREIDPDRVLLVEGIYKSVIGRQRSPSQLIKTFPRKGIVYAFHYYKPDKFTHKRDAGGKTLTRKNVRKVARDMKLAVKFSKSKKVPVVISEFGVWGPYIQNGKLKSGVSAKDRAKWAKAVYKGTISKGVGLTWWALHDHNTPYQRLRYAPEKRQPELVIDRLLWKALRLKEDQ